MRMKLMIEQKFVFINVNDLFLGSGGLFGVVKRRFNELMASELLSFFIENSLDSRLS